MWRKTSDKVDIIRIIEEVRPLRPRLLNQRDATGEEDKYLED